MKSYRRAGGHVVSWHSSQLSMTTIKDRYIIVTSIDVIPQQFPLVQRKDVVVQKGNREFLVHSIMLGTIQLGTLNPTLNIPITQHAARERASRKWKGKWRIFNGFGELNGR